MSNKQEIHFMKEALKEASQARNDGDWAIGCIITLDDEIIIRGRNYVFSKHNRLYHAEIDAITQLQEIHFDSRDKNLALYATTEPCPMCFGAILLAGIRKVVTGANFDESGASAYINYLPNFFKQTHFKTKYISGILAKECAQMWLSGEPAQALISRGFIPPRPIQEVKDDIQIYTTPILE